MPRTLSVLILVAVAVLTSCPSTPPRVLLIANDGSVLAIDGSIDTASDVPDSTPPVDGQVRDGTPPIDVAMLDGIPPIDAAPDGTSPMDAAAAIDIGFPGTLPGTQTMDNNDLVAFPIKVLPSQAGELVGWGLQSVSGPAGTQVRMAIYSNAGTMNQPATLLTQSGAWNLASGVQPTSGFLLNAGDYWLLLSVSDTISIGRSTANPAESRECFRALVFTTAFPNAWGSGSCFAANPINVFIRVRPTT